MDRRSMLYLSSLAALGCLTKTNGEENKDQKTMFDSAGEIDKRAIPSSGQRIAAVGLGTWQTFDVDNSEEERLALKEVLNKLVEKRGSVIDSSPMYGSSEAVVGDLSSQLKIRPSLFLATKVWAHGRQEGIDQMNASFSKMRTEVMDLMQVHNLMDVQTHLKTLRDWKEKGKIKYIGITHYTSSAYPEMIRLIKNEKPDFVQFNYNISARDAESELLPLAKEKGVAVIINRPFEEGALFSAVKGKTLPAWATDYDIKSWGQFFLKYILSHPAVTCVIPGTSKVKHMEDNLGAAFGRLPDEKGRKKMADYYR
jgi:diketogulonate reductase-like aldo/keto reductase